MTALPFAWTPKPSQQWRLRQRKNACLMDPRKHLDPTGVSAPGRIGNPADLAARQRGRGGAFAGRDSIVVTDARTNLIRSSSTAQDSDSSQRQRTAVLASGTTPELTAALGATSLAKHTANIARPASTASAVVLTSPSRKTALPGRSMHGDELSRPTYIVCYVSQKLI